MARKLLLVFIFLACCSVAYAADLMSDNAMKHFKEGVTAQQSGNIYDANVNYDKALLLAPYNVNLQDAIANNRAVMIAETGDIEAAEVAFDNILSKNPDYEPAKINLGFIYEKQRNELDSIKYWLKVLNINLDEVKPKGFILDDQEVPEQKK